MIGRTPIDTAAELATLDYSEIVEGYRDGFNGESEPGDNRSLSYWHGWRNGHGDKAGTADAAQHALAHDMRRRTIARLTRERDEAILKLAAETFARGEAETRLKTSETAGVVEGWRQRAEKAEAELAKAREALIAVVSATGAYLPPDGISAEECVAPVIATTDNPAISAIQRRKMRAALTAALPDFVEACARAIPTTFDPGSLPHFRPGHNFRAGFQPSARSRQRGQGNERKR
jgi:hypothetical protein